VLIYNLMTTCFVLLLMHAFIVGSIRCVLMAPLLSAHPVGHQIYHVLTRHPCVHMCMCNSCMPRWRHSPTDLPSTSSSLLSLLLTAPQSQSVRH